MPKNRAERRHHEKRIRNRVRTFLKDVWYANDWLAQRVDPDDFEKKVCKMAQARKPCSCHMCGNPRKYMDGRKDSLTMQELRAKESEKYESDF